MPPARDSEEAVAVEGGAIGAADTFDGNHTASLMSWMYANKQWKEPQVSEMLDQLMMWTAAGHLAWCVFVTDGYRI